MTNILRIVLASCMMITAAHACDFNTEPAGLARFYRSEGWKLPEISNGKVSAPIVFREYPKSGKGLPFPVLGPIPGLTIRMVIRDATDRSPNLFQIPRQEYELNGKHRVMLSQNMLFDHWVYRYEANGQIVAYNFRLTPVEGHWTDGKWIEDAEAGCEFNATFVDDRGDGVFRILLLGVLTPDLVPQWALDRHSISN